jgi:L-threonylcarbamoyladenylate synthase
MTDILSRQKYNKEDMNCAIEALRKGSIVLFPTELGWVLGCDACNSVAVEKLSALSRFFDNKSPILLVDNAAKLTSYVLELPELTWDLIEFSEKPLSIIFTGTKNLADPLSGDSKSVLFRVTSGFFASNLCTRFRNPIYTIQIKKDTNQMHELIELVDIHVKYEDSEPVFLKSHGIIKLDKGNLFKIIE